MTNLKRLLVGLHLCYALSASSIAAQTQLNAASISFVTPTNTDDKDWNTNVTVFLYMTDGTEIGRIDYSSCNNNSTDDQLRECFCCAKYITDAHGAIINPKTLFQDNGTERGPFRFTLIKQSTKQEVKTGYFIISIRPNGNDRWVFTPKLFLTFSDGSKLAYTNYQRAMVGQDAPQATFVFNGKR
jgi:hypothetical protein